MSLASRLQQGGVHVAALVLLDAVLQLAAVPESLRIARDPTDIATADEDLRRGFRAALLGGDAMDTAQRLALAHFERCTALLNEHVVTERNLTCAILDVRPLLSSVARVPCDSLCASSTSQRIDISGADHWTLLQGDSAKAVGRAVQEALD